MHQRREHEKGWITYMNIFKYSLRQNGLHNRFSIESLILQQEIMIFFTRILQYAVLNIIRESIKRASSNNLARMLTDHDACTKESSVESHLWNK
jgi:hypothetical protein